MKNNTFDKSILPKITFTPEVLALCDEGWRPLSLTSLILYVVRSHFSDANNIKAPVLQDKLWTMGTDTGILVESIGRWRPQLTEKRPAVIVKRNALKVLRQGINDRMMLGTGIDQARSTYATLVQGSHTLFCLAGESAEAEVLGAEVYQELLQFAPAIRSAMSLHRFQVVDISELTLIEEATENFAVMITVAYVFEEAWEIVSMSPKMAGVTTSTNIR